MKIAHAIFFVLWLLASLYSTNSHCVNSHNLNDCLLYNSHTPNQQFPKSSTLSKNWEKCSYSNHIFPLNIFSLQAPLVDKWNGKLFREVGRISITTNHNIQILLLCRMAHSRNLDRTFDGIKDMETSQNKKRTSSYASLTIVEKNKNKSNTPKKNGHLWLGFKAMNALNVSKGLDEVAHRSVSELVKFGMSDKEALECQNCVSSYSHVP